MSDTPETDSLREAIDNGAATEAEMTSLAGKLERERDEARKDADEWARSFCAVQVQRDEALDNLRITQNAWIAAKVKRVEAFRERDEARDDAAHWKTEYEIVVARLRGIKHPRDNGIVAPDEIIPMLTRERDEARAKLECLLMDSEQGEPQPLRAGEPSDFEGAIRRMRDAERERDQARRELDIQLEGITFHMERVPVRDHPLRADDAKLEMTQKEAND